ncbi:MAG: UDP-N-acetylmuramoyl-L-alanine--D-glutamate ligase [Gammaproteobacteria bacterium]
MQTQAQRKRDGVDDARRALVVGLGATGLSAARWLSARGVSVAVTDSRARPPKVDALREHVPDAALFLGGFSVAALDRSDLVVLSPGVPRADPFVQQALAAGIPVVGDIELFARHARAPVVAVTGSNGKSTVTTLVGVMAERAGVSARVGGNLGTPALDLLGDGEPALYTLELSSFQLETTSSLDAAAAALLNLSADHLDRYDDLHDYLAAKARVWRGHGVVIANYDDERVRAAVPDGRIVRWFSLGAPRGADDYGLIEHDGEPWLSRGHVRLLPQSALRIAGRHNVANALAALALGTAAGLTDAPMLAVLASFRGLPHRMEWVAEVTGVQYYNDSKATNVGATIAAVSGLQTQFVVILGGDGKGQDFGPLAAALRGRVRTAIVVGRDSPRIAQALAAAGVPHTAAEDMPSAVRAASRAAIPGDLVLLSPACSSLDQFENFEARGRVFAEAVRGLA